LNCPWHPNKRVVTSCKDCGAGFCIECVRETDQTTLCANCYRRKLDEIAKEFTEPDEPKGERPPVPASVAPEERPAARPQAPPGEAAEPPAVPAAPPAGKVAGWRGGEGGREQVPPEPSAGSQADFLSQGPDEDFSQISEDKPKKGRWFRGARSEVSPPADTAEPPGAADETTGAAGDAQPARAAVVSEDELLKDVMSTLLKPEAAAPERPSGAARIEARDVSATRVIPEGVEARKEKKRERKRAVSERREGMGENAVRWSFLAQPRSSEYTLIATSWWKAALFIALMLLLGAALWALPNAYLIPRDQEYGIHAVAVGIILGLAFWWKAGKKHSTKLAVQASLTTFFALFTSSPSGFYGRTGQIF
jgi:hypothetical protein